MMNHKQSVTNEVLTCPIHKIPYEGICGEKKCFVEGLICYQCSPECCIKIFKHQLISLEQFSQEHLTSLLHSTNMSKLQSLLAKAKLINNTQLISKLKAFEDFTSKVIDKKLFTFTQHLSDKLNQFQAKINNKLLTISKDYYESNSNFNEVTPNYSKLITLKEVVDYLSKARDSAELSTLAICIKQLSDKDKVNAYHNDLKRILFTRNLIGYKTEENPNEVINDFCSKMRAYLSHTVEQLLVNRNNEVFHAGMTQRFTSNPSVLQFKEDLVTDADQSYAIDSVFAVFNSFDGNTYLACTESKSFSIKVLNLKDKSIQMLSGHQQHIYIIRHYPHNQKRCDYLISTSSERCVKVWNLLSFRCEVTLPACHMSIYLYSALLLFNDYTHSDCIITSAPNEYMKVFDFSSGEMIREIGMNGDYTYHIDLWRAFDQSYVVNANSSNVKIYSLTGRDEAYKQFNTGNVEWHMSAFVEKVKGVDYLFETSSLGWMRMWIIETEEVFKSIRYSDASLRGICLWSDNVVIAASSLANWAIINLNEKEVLLTQKSHKDIVSCVQKLVHPIYGETLVSFAIDGTIKLWTQKI